MNTINKITIKNVFSISTGKKILIIYVFIYTHGWYMIKEEEDKTITNATFYRNPHGRS